MSVNIHNSQLLELEDCKQMIFKTVSVIRAQKLKLRQEPEKFTKMSTLETQLIGDANTIATWQIRDIITDLYEPRNRIETVTKNVEYAINKLRDFNKLISILTSFVNLFGKIVGAVSGGLSVVAISSLLDEIDQLSAQ